jgi:hypothetical protein
MSLVKKYYIIIGLKQFHTMTSQKQTSLFTEEELTYLPEASPVNPTHQPENEKERKMSATSGRKCSEQLKKFNHVGLWAKMFSALLIGQEGWFSTKCKLTWKLRGTKYGRMYCQLQVSTLPTEGIEFGLLPTPRAQEIENSKERIANNQIDSLPTMAKIGLLPTPTAIQREHPERVQALQETGATTMFSRANGEARPNSILDHLQFHKMFPTPTTNCAKGAATRTDPKRQSDTLAHHFNTTPGKTSQLNPPFVLEMMGFPPDWTELPFLNGETNQSKQPATQ